MVELLKLVTRLAGIMIIVAGVRGIIPYVVMYKQGDAIQSFDQVGFAGQGLIILIGLALTMFPQVLAISGGTVELPVAGVAELAPTLVATVGLYLASSGLIDVAYYLTYALHYRSLSAPTAVPFPSDFVAGAWSTAVGLLVGIVLIVMRHKVYGLIQRVRMA